LKKVKKIKVKKKFEKISISWKLPLVELPLDVETNLFMTSSMYCFGMMFMFEISTMEEKHITALEGMKIVSRGK